jgi:polysaccharide deacetylase family protein (PEP-CTERM system associated)
MQDRSEGPLQQHMDLCDDAGVKCTYFFLGWYAKKFPQRVAEVIKRGHEVGCHSLHHEDIATQTTEEFLDTTRLAKEMIQDASGQPVYSYRAPSFSFPPKRCKELLSTLVEIGFKLDSSITTAKRVLGGGYSKDVFAAPGSTKPFCGVDIFEVPVPGVSVVGREFQVFGGGYLRLAPRPFINMLIAREAYQVLYLHPHDFDKNLPALPNTSLFNNSRRHLNIGSLQNKIKDIFAGSTVMNCAELYAQYEGDLGV